jgi:hypothetical protein
MLKFNQKLMQISSGVAMVTKLVGQNFIFFQFLGDTCTVILSFLKRERERAVTVS